MTWHDPDVSPPPRTIPIVRGSSPPRPPKPPREPSFILGCVAVWFMFVTGALAMGIFGAIAYWACLTVLRGMGVVD